MTYGDLGAKAFLSVSGGKILQWPGRNVGLTTTKRSGKALAPKSPQVMDLIPLKPLLKWLGEYTHTEREEKN